MKHLSRIRGRFCVRIGVPENLRGIIGRRELREWLGHDRTVAERAAPAIIGKFYKIIDEAKAKLATNQPTFFGAARSHYQSELVADDRERAVRDRNSPDMSWSKNERAVMLRLLAAGQLADDAAEALMGYAADQAISLGTASPTMNRCELLRVMAEVQLEAMARFEDRDKGNVTVTPPTSKWLQPEAEEESKSAVVSNAVTARPKSEGKILLELAKEFHRERQTGHRSLAEKTMKEHLVAVHLLEEVVGKVPADTLSKKDIIAFKAALMGTPTNYKQRFPGKRLTAAIEANQKRKEPFRTLDARTINHKYLAHIGTILQWCEVNDHIDRNVARGIKVATAKAKNAQTIKPFTADDLKRIFGDPMFADPKTYTTKHWALLMALYTGARSISELSRIKLADIFQQDGVWVVHLSEASKNAHSKRIVPLHKKLIELGLLAYVEKMRAAKKERLFPDWSASGNVNRWFIRTHMPLVGIVDKAKVFHSFRHTLKTALAYQGVNRDISDLITGHKDQSVSAMYIADADFTMIKSMKEAIDRVNFGFGGVSTKV